MLANGSSMRDVLNVANALSEAQKKRRSYRIVDQIDPFVQGLLRFEKAMDVFSNTNKFMSLVWGSTKVLLIVSQLLLVKWTIFVSNESIKACMQSS